MLESLIVDKHFSIALCNTPAIGSEILQIIAIVTFALTCRRSLDRCEAPSSAEGKDEAHGQRRYGMLASWGIPEVGSAFLLRALCAKAPFQLM